MTQITDQQFAQLRYRIYNYSFKITKNVDDAEDVVQNTFYKFYIQEPDIQHPKSWLFKVAYNMSINVLKKREKVKSIEELREKINFQIPTYDEGIDKQKENLPFETLKKSLNPQDIRIYKYYFVKQLSSIQIANKMKIKPKTAQKYVQRMRRNLKAAILKEQGLTWTKNILTYQQYENVGNFIKLLIKKTQNNNIASLRSYFQNFSLESMPEFTISQIKDWGIRLKENGYLMTLFCLDESDKVLFLSISFRINKLNRIKIFSVKKPGFFKVKKDSTKAKLSKSSNVNLTYDEIKKLEGKKKGCN